MERLICQALVIQQIACRFMFGNRLLISFSCRKSININVCIASVFLKHYRVNQPPPGDP